MDLSANLLHHIVTGITMAVYLAIHQVIEMTTSLILSRLILYVHRDLTRFMDNFNRDPTNNLSIKPECHSSVAIQVQQFIKC